MQENRFFSDKSKALKECEASRDLLAFMAFNLEQPVTVNRMYFEGTENKTIILIHFTFRGNDWLLQRDVVKDQWSVKLKSKALFAPYTKQEIIDGKF